MRVVQINSYSNGSTGHVANSIHQALIARGDESLFAFGMGPDIKEGGYRVGNKLDFFLHTVMSLFTGLHGYGSWLNTKRLVDKLKEFRPDIIHLHNLHGGYINIQKLLRYLAKSNAKIVMTVHDCWIYTGKCYHYYEAGCDKYLKNCGNCPQLRMYPKSYFFDFTPKMLKDKRKWLLNIKDLHLITVSDWLHQEVASTFLGEYPIKTVKNGVNALFKLASREESAERKTVATKEFVILGVASSWNIHKGIYDFIALSKLLKPDEKIVLVGNGVRELDLPKNITVIDQTQNIQELVEIYTDASVYVSMSTEETFGMTIAEAMCCGTPAIVYNATACAEMVTPGVNGYVVPAHDVAQVYSCIEEVKNGQLFDRNMISENAIDRFSNMKMIQEYLEYYESIL